MDTTVSPKDDFYNFVNGNWDKKTTIPEDQVRWGGFGVLRKSTDKDVLEILDKAAKTGPNAKNRGLLDQLEAPYPWASAGNENLRYNGNGKGKRK